MYTDLSRDQTPRVFNNAKRSGRSGAGNDSSCNNTTTTTTTTGTAGTPLIDTCYRNEAARARYQTNKESGRQNWRRIKPAAPHHSSSARNQKNFRPEFRVSRFTGDWHWPRSYAGRRTASTTFGPRGFPTEAAKPGLSSRSKDSRQQQ